MSSSFAALLPRTLPRFLLTLSVLVLGLVALSPLPAYALENRAFGDVVVGPGETESEVSTAVGNVKVEGFVEGDVHSARGDIEVDGERGVGGDINAGMGDVEVRAPVGGDIDAGFGDVYVDAHVRGDVKTWSWGLVPGWTATSLVVAARSPRTPKPWSVGSGSQA